MSETKLQPGDAIVIDQVLTDEDDQQQLSLDEDVEFDEEWEDELIIEDFTIDGICGVY